jgi:SnoaL-like domain
MKIGMAPAFAGFWFVMALAGSILFGTRVLEAHPTIGLESSEDALQTGRKQTMSHSISSLLIRNLQDVFGENDTARRRAAIDEIFTEDCVFYEPNGGVYRGRDEIDRVAGSLRAAHGDYRYQPIAEPEEMGNGGRIRWVEGRPGEAPVVAGTDFIIARDGRIAAIYLFFDKLP